MAGVLGYPTYVREGRFRGCAGVPDEAEIKAYLEAARSMTSNYYHGLLIDALMRN